MKKIQHIGVYLFIMAAILLSSLFSANAEEFIQFENLTYYKSSYPQTAIVATKDHIIKAVEEKNTDTIDDFYWFPKDLSVFMKSKTDLNETRIADVSISGVWHMVSDGENAYLLIREIHDGDDQFDDYIKLALIDTYSMTLHWYGATEETPYGTGIYANDFVAHSGNLYLISEYEIRVMNIHENDSRVLYKSIDPIDNVFNNNHVVFHDGQLFISKHGTQIHSVDILTGEERFIVNASTSPYVRNCPEYWRSIYRYYIYNDELIFNSLNRKFTCAFNLADKTERDIVRDRLGIYYSDKNGVYVDDGYYGCLQLNTIDNKLQFIDEPNYETVFFELICTDQCGSVDSTLILP